MGDEFSFAPSKVFEASFPRKQSFGTIAKVTVSSTSRFLTYGSKGDERGESIAENEDEASSHKRAAQAQQCVHRQHLQPRPWSEIDFSGRYHKYQIKSKYPIPGTAVAKDVELRHQGQVRRDHSACRK